MEREQEPDQFWTWVGIIFILVVCACLLTGCGGNAADVVATPTPQEAAPLEQSWYSLHANGKCGKSESPGDMMETILTNGYQPKFSQTGALVTVWYSNPAADMRYTYIYYHRIDDCQRTLDQAHYIPAELR